MNEIPTKSRVGRPLGSTKPKVSADPPVRLKIEVSAVQFKQLRLMVEHCIGKSPEAIIEAWVSAEITKRLKDGENHAQSN